MKQPAGFTIIEMLVSIIVSGIFILAIYQIVGTVTTLSVSSSQRYTADAVSYANLRTYANGRTPTWFSCPAVQTDPVTLLSSTAAVTGLPPPVTQTVIADAPYGCSATATGQPIRVTSTITYGINSITIRNATYATY